MAETATTLNLRARRWRWSDESQHSPAANPVAMLADHHSHAGKHTHPLVVVRGDVHCLRRARHWVSRRLLVRRPGLKDHPLDDGDGGVPLSTLLL